MTVPSPHSIDLLVLGNAIVDVLSHVDEAQMGALPVNKVGMTLIDSRLDSGPEPARLRSHGCRGGGRGHLARRCQARGRPAGAHH